MLQRGNQSPESTQDLPEAFVTMDPAMYINVNHYHGPRTGSDNFGSYARRQVRYVNPDRVRPARDIDGRGSRME